MDSNTPKGETKLSEKDFIQEGYSKDPFPFWIWTAIIIAILALAWGLKGLLLPTVNPADYGSFSKVTNREFSLFLWENPEYMRSQSKNKSAYLTGFQLPPKVNIKPGESEHLVIATPDALHMYHTWHRLLSKKDHGRKIPKDEFKKFIAYAEEWQPQNWDAAPDGYKSFFDSLEGGEQLPDNLATLDRDSLPDIVRDAFTGWKNFFMEGNQINESRPSYREMEEFLSTHPEYDPSLWRNVLEERYPKYLESFNATISDPDALVPNEEMAPFLRVGYFNYAQAKKGL